MASAGDQSLPSENNPVQCLTCSRLWGLPWVSQNLRYIAGCWLNRDSNCRWRRWQQREERRGGKVGQGNEGGSRGRREEEERRGGGGGRRRGGGGGGGRRRGRARKERVEREQ